MTLLDRLLIWYTKLRPHHLVWLVGSLIAGMLWLGAVSDQTKQDRILRETSEQVNRLESLMQDELRASAKLHGRLLQRLERLEALHPSTDQEKGAK